MTSAATDLEIKSAYRKIATATHPDQARTAARVAEFSKAAEAYDVLHNQRAEYDEHRRQLSQQAAQRKARERQAADEAARAGQQEAERRVRMAQPNPLKRPFPEVRRPEADSTGLGPAPRPPGPPTPPSAPPALYVVWNGVPLSQTAFQAMVDESRRSLASLRGPDIKVTVVGQRGFHLNGFTITSPTDGGSVELPPGLPAGLYLAAEGRGGFAPFGGPRGNLLIDYRWPAPIRGLDAETSVSIPAKECKRGHTIVNPFNQEELQIPPGTEAGDLHCRLQGLPGEFDGRAGDLVVHVELEGRRSTVGGTLLLVLLVAVIIWVAVQLLY